MTEMIEKTAQPDSETVARFVRLSTTQVKMNGGISASIGLEMIGYMRMLEREYDYLKQDFMVNAAGELEPSGTRHRQKEVECLQTALRFAAGELSTYRDTDKHPKTVYDELLEAAKDGLEVDT